jgi:hypothetical protein
LGAAAERREVITVEDHEGAEHSVAHPDHPPERLRGRYGTPRSTETTRFAVNATFSGSRR